MNLPILAPPRLRWECPNCDQQVHAPPGEHRTPYHRCRGLVGLNAPMVPAGTRAKVSAVERGDWVGAEQVQTDGEGRPVMAITTERDDGIDCAVLAPTATASRS